MQEGQKKSYHTNFLKHGDFFVAVQWKNNFVILQYFEFIPKSLSINLRPASFARAWAHGQKCTFTLSFISCAVFLMVFASLWSNSEAR